ncbi:MAG: hypothetical protein GC204_04660 [Chloroflexi bacterium]|nr:hypothetical protein [Chloroflexota bacterium]
MSQSNFSRLFSVVALTAGMAGCSTLDARDTKYFAPPQPSTYRLPAPQETKTTEQVDAATRRRIMNYHRGHDNARAQRFENCTLRDQFEGKTGLFSYQANDRTNFAFGIKGDGTRASRDIHGGFGVGLKMTIRLGRHSQTKKDRCLEDTKWRGIVPSAVRLGPEIQSYLAQPK